MLDVVATFTYVLELHPGAVMRPLGCPCPAFPPPGHQQSSLMCPGLPQLKQAFDVLCQHWSS
jgi:hypothetical protein